MELVPINTSATAASRFHVQGQVELRARRIVWTMQVRGTGAWHVNSKFSSDYRKNWELWNFDVVETFLQLRRHADDVHAPYLELQLSPLNQPLALVILEPRVSFYTPLHLSLTTHNQLAGEVWQTRCEVELPTALQGPQLWGGLFACLGEGQREYHALSPWAPAPANFHLPSYFQRLA